MGNWFGPSKAEKSAMAEQQRDVKEQKSIADQARASTLQDLLAQSTDEMLRKYGTKRSGSAPAGGGAQSPSGSSIFGGGFNVGQFTGGARR